MTRFHMINYFPKPLYSYSQWWFQMNNVLYMTGDFPDEDAINLYNLITNIFNDHFFRVPTDYVQGNPCLTGDYTAIAVLFRRIA